MSDDGPKIVLTDQQVKDLSGGYVLPARQLRALHARGYWRAYIGKHGKVVVETAHYEAVSRGDAAPPARSPKLRTPTLRPA